MTSRRQRAFTMIELLVVISIIAVLAGMILAGANLLREAAKRGRTEAMLGSLLSAVHTWSAEFGGLPSPAEHPLAGSRAPRSAFVRAAGGTIAVNGMALVGVDQTNLSPADQDRLLLPDDRFADTGIPTLFGLSRDRLGVLGAALGEATRFKQLPLPANMGAIIANPDDAQVGSLISPPDGPSASDRMVRSLLGKGGHFDELQKQGVLWYPPDDNPTTLVYHARVWSVTVAGADVPGTATVLDGGTPHRYRLRGPGFYDAWGNDILVSVTENGRNLRLMSAGRDGHFTWHPGPDGVFQTDPRAATASGDDRDGAKDNLVLGER